MSPDDFVLTVATTEDILLAARAALGTETESGWAGWRSDGRSKPSTAATTG